MSNNTPIENDVEAEFFGKRVVAPDTGALKERILAATKSLPQKRDNAHLDSPLEQSIASKRLSLRSIKLGPQALACGAFVLMVLVSASMLLPSQSPLVPEPNFLSADDIELHEMMLLEDDLLFAEL